MAFIVSFIYLFTESSIYLIRLPSEILIIIFISGYVVSVIMVNLFIASIKKIINVISLFILIGFFIFCVFNLNQEPYRFYRLAQSPSDFLPICPLKNNRNTDLMIKKWVQTKHEKRIVARTMRNGLGNRMHHLVSSIALAISLNRSLHFQWTLYSKSQTNFSNIFETPISYESIDDSLAETPNCKMFYCRPCIYRRPLKSYADIVSKSKDIIEPYDSFVVESSHFFIPELYTNPDLRSVLCDLFDLEDAHAAIFNTLFKPHPLVQEFLNETLSQLSNYTLIGLQMRLSEDGKVSDHTIYQFFHCANALSHKYSNPMFFLATDKKKMKIIAQNVFGDRLFTFNNKGKGKDLKGIQAAVFDIYMLSKCQDVILSPFSTFGAMASGISKVAPHFIEQKNGICFKDITHTPKSHYWFGLSRILPMIQGSDSINQYDISL